MILECINQLWRSDRYLLLVLFYRFFNIYLIDANIIQKGMNILFNSLRLIWKFNLVEYAFLLPMEVCAYRLANNAWGHNVVIWCFNCGLFRIYPLTIGDASNCFSYMIIQTLLTSNWSFVLKCLYSQLIDTWSEIPTSLHLILYFLNLIL